MNTAVITPGKYSPFGLEGFSCGWLVPRPSYAKQSCSLDSDIRLFV